MSTIDEATYLALQKRVARLTSAYADGYRAGLERGLHGTRVRIEGVPPHSQAIKRTDRWGAGYEAGIVGSDPHPPKGAEPKGDGQARDKTVIVRVTAAQRKEYDKRGGNAWLLEELSGVRQ